MSKNQCPKRRPTLDSIPAVVPTLKPPIIGALMEPLHVADTPPTNILEDLEEAQAICAGNASISPQLRHLQALRIKVEFWRNAARDLQEQMAVLRATYDLRAQAADEFADTVVGGYLQ